MLSPMTQEELAKINPDYMTVPENLYTLSEKCSKFRSAQNACL